MHYVANTERRRNAAMMDYDDLLSVTTSRLVINGRCDIYWSFYAGRINNLRLLSTDNFKEFL